MHERPVKERIPFTEHDHIFTLREVSQTVSPIVIEGRQQTVVFRIAEVDLCRDGVFHRMFHRRLGHDAVHNGAGLPAPSGFAEKRDVLRAG